MLLYQSEQNLSVSDNVWKDDPEFKYLFFAEKRTHGVGFYDFARDEESRQEQLKALDELRNQVKLTRTLLESMIIHISFHLWPLNIVFYNMM